MHSYDSFSLLISSIPLSKQCKAQDYSTKSESEWGKSEVFRNNYTTELNFGV